MVNLVEKLTNSGKKLYLVITGGGTAAFSKLLENGGASTFFVGGRIPYDERELEDFLGEKVKKSVSVETARLIATQSYLYAARWYGHNSVGVGVTASLKRAGTEREGRKHHAYLAMRRQGSDGGTWNYLVDTYVELPNTLTRQEQEDALAQEILGFVDRNILN